MVEKLEVLKCTWKVLENQSTFVMYLSTSTSTQGFSVLYKLYLSTDVLKYKVLLPGSDMYYFIRWVPANDILRVLWESPRL